MPYQLKMTHFNLLNMLESSKIEIKLFRQINTSINPYIIYMDFLFLEFYIQKKYNQKVGEYFNVSKQSVSQWKGEIPEKRLLQFHLREGSIIPEELIKKIY